MQNLSLNSMVSVKIVYQQNWLSNSHAKLKK